MHFRVSQPVMTTIAFKTDPTMRESETGGTRSLKTYDKTFSIGQLPGMCMIHLVPCFISTRGTIQFSVKHGTFSL